MSEELKPCAHCGGEAECDQQGCTYFVFCTKCGVSTDTDYIKDVVVENWNTRPSPWISVEDRSPKEEGQVWICYKKTGYTYGGYYKPIYKLWQIFDPCGGWSNIDPKSPPSHWQPIELPNK